MSLFFVFKKGNSKAGIRVCHLQIIVKLGI